jgi:hypothetical protein
MNYALYVIAALMTVGTLRTISQVGKPSIPITNSTAAYITALNMIAIIILILAAMRLS